MINFVRTLILAEQTIEDRDENGYVGRPTVQTERTYREFAESLKELLKFLDGLRPDPGIVKAWVKKAELVYRNEEIKFLTKALSKKMQSELKEMLSNKTEQGKN